MSAAMGDALHAGDAPIGILVCALGGEGGGVLAEWLYDAAVRAGLAAQATSIPGVAQRTGATTYYIEVAPRPGLKPVFALAPVPGCIDLLVSSELLETLRQAGLGLVSRERTQVISSTARTLTVAERIALGDGRADEARLLATLATLARELRLLDFNRLARESGTAISAVLLGAIAASGRLPIARSDFEVTVRAQGLAVDASLRGFAAAFDAYRALPGAASGTLSAPAPPVPAPDLRQLARQRLIEYQDAAYARLYDERLARLEAAAGAGSATMAECVRWLALWMAFDDIVRVAQLKLAASRVERVRREVRAGPGDVLKVFEHFKPGIAEVAALLPGGLAERLLAWDRRRIARGLEPWSMALRLPSHSLRGMLALRGLASLKGLRRRGQRFALEQRLIEAWLAAVERGAREQPALGEELARCGRLIKGYGSTNERGKAALQHIVEHLAFGPRPAAERAAAVRAAREAALADDAGRALAEVSLAHGAPRPEPRAQPIRFVRNTGAARSRAG